MSSPNLRSVRHIRDFSVADNSRQTLYIFFGVATLVGLFAGISLQYASNSISEILQLDSAPAEWEGKSLELHHTTRRAKCETEDPLRTFVQDVDGPSKSQGATQDIRWTKGRGRCRRGLIPNTILEEDDSS